MRLTFEYSMDCGAGHYPQAIHDKTNRLRIVHLAGDSTVHSLDADPVLGLYDDLEFINKGRISPDDNVSLPSLKRVAHYGAYGFWSAEGDHRFVIYMMPVDISKSLVDGSVQFGIGSEVSSLSCSLLNIRGELLNRYRALVTPGTKLEVYVSLGSSGEVPLGIYYIDHANVAYPDEQVSVSARNAIGKLLKEQYFDEDNVFDYGSIHDNIEAILELAEVENYFVGDPGTDKKLEFDADTTVLEGIRYAISLLSNWKIGETLDGVVGIASATDARFDPPGVYVFERDHTCWNYHIEYDDSDAAARVCVYSEPAEEEAEDIRVYKDVKFNKWWSQPSHRTLYVQTVDGATLEQVTNIAETLADSIAASGRTETFAGLFTPQLVIGDEVRVIDEHGGTDTVGSVTDIKHNFGNSGFYTSFTVDSGGRKGRTRLKDLITTASDFPEVFTGKKHETEPVPVVEVSMRNSMAIEETSSTSITGTFFTIGGNLVIASVVHRYDLGATPSGWTLLHTSSGIPDGNYVQRVSVFYAHTTQASLTPTFTQASAGRLYVNFVSFSNAGTPALSLPEETLNATSYSVSKNTTAAVLWEFHRVYWGSGNWTVSGVGSSNLIQREEAGRLLTIFDDTDNRPLTVAASSGSAENTEFLSVCIPIDS